MWVGVGGWVVGCGWVGGWVGGWVVGRSVSRGRPGPQPPPPPPPALGDQAIARHQHSTGPTLCPSQRTLFPGRRAVPGAPLPPPRAPSRPKPPLHPLLRCCQSRAAVRTQLGLRRRPAVRAAVARGAQRARAPARRGAGVPERPGLVLRRSASPAFECRSPCVAQRPKGQGGGRGVHWSASLKSRPWPPDLMPPPQPPPPPSPLARTIPLVGATQDMSQNTSA